MEAIIVAFITGGLSLVGVILSNISSNKKIEHQLQVSQAVTETKIEELTREVREHNNFAKRMPAVEATIEFMDKRLSKIENQRRTN